MRISDWSSDVCSSDLTRTVPCPQLLAAHRLELGAGRSSLPGCGTTALSPTAAWINGSVSHAVEFDDIFREAVYHPGCPVLAAALAVAEEQNDRKSVVEGKRVSVRVDLGGGRINKKKK